MRTRPRVSPTTVTILAAAAAVACEATPEAQSPSNAEAVCVSTPSIASAPPTEVCTLATATAGFTREATSPGAHPFGVADLLSFDRVSEPSTSADGRLVAFSVSTPDVAANKMMRDIWLAATDGSSVRRLTSHPGSDTSPRFAPDGRSIYFLSTRSGSSQVWRIATDGGEATQVTDLPVDVDGVLPFKDGRRLLLVMDVYPDAGTLDETAKRDKAKEGSNESVRAYDQLPVRHWDTWDEGKRTHLFVLTTSADGGAKTPPIDLLAGVPYDAPVKPFGGLDDVSVSPDGKEVVFTSKMVGREDAWSTNTDLFLVPADGSAKPRSITRENAAEDMHPVFSHDGTKLAYLAMARPGFESDLTRIVVMDWKTKTSHVLAPSWDRPASEIAWSTNDRTIYTTADNLGRKALFALDAATGRVTTLVDKGSTSDVQVLGNRLLFRHDDLTHPDELWTVNAAGGVPHPVTHLNDAKRAAIAWGEPEQFTFTGAKGDKVYGWIVKPAGIAPGAKVPVAFLIHGGPQGSFGDDFHYRWNPAVFAGHGYAAIAIDFHGSTGYGQAFTDAIRDDWGGAPFEDLMKGLDAALEKYPFLDRTRMAALGASYGGFMINWVNGHTDRFKALVCHDGNIDEKMAYFQTEELWFPEWEHKGLPWENPEGYAKQSPVNYVQNWKTPTLVVHGGKDYRVVDTEGLGTFTALQRRGIPSRLLYFPGENHWVLKPAHSRRWHEEVFAWIDRWTR